MKAIFEQPMEQGFAEKIPTRELILPNQLQTLDKTVSSRDQLRLVLASVSLQGRILLTLDIAETF